MNFTSRTFALIFLLLIGCAMTSAGCAGPSGQAASDDSTLTPTEQEGARLFTHHCSSCHATTGDTIVVGPSLAGVAARAGTRVEGQDPRTYLETSIRSPEAYMVEGFANLMPPTLGESLTDEEIDALIAFLLTLE